ncbi:hypothetical protein DL98DRAFT_521269 [Cadophora sp. DSE1049]|nr:hypothetical protein DL98DRAFT_521269 [Cadophora sp. DSE1049]
MLIGPPCYNCTQDEICCEKPTSRRQKKARPDLEESLNSCWPQNLLDKDKLSPPPVTQNPFEGEFGFAGDLQGLLEAHFRAISECPCEQFGLLACPFCDTETLSNHVIKGTERR